MPDGSRETGEATVTPIAIILAGGRASDRVAVRSRFIRWGARCAATPGNDGGHRFLTSLDRLASIDDPDLNKAKELFYLFERDYYGGHGLVLMVSEIYRLIPVLKKVEDAGLVKFMAVILTEDSEDPAAARPGSAPQGDRDALKPFHQTIVSTSDLTAADDPAGQAFLRKLGFNVTHHQLKP